MSINLEQVRTNFGGDENKVKEILTLTISSLHANEIALKKAIKERDLQKCRQVYHQIKGSALTINAEDLLQYLKAYEDTSKRNEKFYENLSKFLKDEILKIETVANSYLEINQ